MSAHLIGVSALGGVPLFSRQVGLKPNEQAIPFATLAALNGVNLFSRLNEANLQATATKSAKIRWKVFKNNIVLILVASTTGSSIELISNKCVENMIDLVFDAFVLGCGIDEICAQNIERLKRSLKLGFPLVDHLLEKLINRESHLNILTTSSNYLYIDASISGFMSTLIDSYASLAQSDFACVIVDGKVLTATKGWWSRISHSRDSVLVIAMVNSMAEILEKEANQIKEVPIYLPENCPNSVTRLIMAKIYQDILLVALCGEHPPLETFVTSAINVMKESDLHQEHFQKIAMLKNGSTLPINDQILAIILVRNDIRSLLRFGNFDDTKLRDMLIMMDIGADASQQDGNENAQRPLESYLKFKQFQAYRIAQGHNQLYVLLPKMLSLNEIRDISTKSMSLFKDKRIWPKVN